MKIDSQYSEKQVFLFCLMKCFFIIKITVHLKNINFTYTVTNVCLHIKRLQKYSFFFPLSYILILSNLFSIVYYMLNWFHSPLIGHFQVKKISAAREQLFLHKNNTALSTGVKSSKTVSVYCLISIENSGSERYHREV